MNKKYRLAQILFVISGFLAVWSPGTAFAHDNVGGDELAVANWMLICAVVVALMGALAAVWAWRAGQFTNVEESKFSMLDTAEDFDAIMAEADARERLANEKAEAARAGEANTDQRGKQAAPASPAARV